MKRFLMFAGQTYYPCGGVEDLQGDYNDIEEAKAAAEASHFDWAQVFDTGTDTFIEWERGGSPRAGNWIPNT